MTHSAHIRLGVNSGYAYSDFATIITNNAYIWTDVNDSLRMTSVSYKVLYYGFKQNNSLF